MAKIHNPTIRLFHLPARSKGDEKFGEGRVLAPGKSLEVPDWYLQELLKERNSAGKATGWALRLETVDGGARVVSPRGVAGSFEARIKSYRAEKAQAERDAKAAAERQQAAEKRIEALEAELASEKREKGKGRGGDGEGETKKKS